VRVVVARVDLDERKIDFELTDKQPTSGAGKVQVRQVKTRTDKVNNKKKKTQSKGQSKKSGKIEKDSKSTRKAKQHGGKKSDKKRSRKKKSRH